MAAADCPAEDELAAVVAGKPTSETLRAHLETCPACSQRLAGLRARAAAASAPGRWSSLEMGEKLADAAAPAAAQAPTALGQAAVPGRWSTLEIGEELAESGAATPAPSAAEKRRWSTLQIGEEPGQATAPTSRSESKRSPEPLATAPVETPVSPPARLMPRGSASVVAPLDGTVGDPSRGRIPVFAVFGAIALFAVVSAGATFVLASLSDLDFLPGLMAVTMALIVALAVFGFIQVKALKKSALAARQLCQYQLGERLPFSGKGEVFRARHPLFNRPLAITLFRPEHGSDAASLRSLEADVQAAARLTHVNTLSIYDHGHAEDGTFYYVSECLPGLGLEELVRRQGPMPPARAVHFLRQVCGSLAEAHDLGIWHRDIVPDNVLVVRQGGRSDVIKLLNFGLTRHPIADAGAARTSVLPGGMTSRAGFLAPELVANTTAADARSDLYGVGALAYFLLTGRPPFVGKTALQTLAAHVHQPVVPLTEHRADVPADVQAVVLRCLAKNPAERFGSALDLDDALARCACARQ